jgi:uncharacterized protein YvpB
VRSPAAAVPLLVAALAACAKPMKANPKDTASRPSAPDPGFGCTVVRGEEFSKAAPPSPSRTGGPEVFASRKIETAPFDSLVLSWNVKIPPGESAEFGVAVRIGGEWWPHRGYRTMAIVSEGRSASVKQDEDDATKVEVDTLVVKPPGRGNAFQLFARLPRGAVLRSLGAAHYLASERGSKIVDAARSPVWGKVLEVATRSQTAEDPTIAARICSPTATAMALEYLGIAIPTKDLAARVYDAASDLYGNWSINAACAGDLVGEAFVGHFDTLAEVEREIAAGRPVVLSHSWKKGELTNAPIPSSAGHLLVVVGFTNDGNVVVNDPAAPAREVRRVYDRRELFHTWQHNGNGIVYLFRPGPH